MALKIQSVPAEMPASAGLASPPQSHQEKNHSRNASIGCPTGIAPLDPGRSLEEPDVALYCRYAADLGNCLEDAYLEDEASAAHRRICRLVALFQQVLSLMVRLAACASAESSACWR